MNATHSAYSDTYKRVEGTVIQYENVCQVQMACLNIKNFFSFFFSAAAASPPPHFAACEWGIFVCKNIFFPQLH